MAKVLVAFPAKFELDADAAIAAANLERCEHDLVFAHSDGRGIYGPGPARNRCVDKALEGGFDYLMMIDSDTIVPANALKLLLDPPAPIVLGIYRYKNSSGDCPFFKPEAVNGNDKWRFDEVPEGRFEVKAAGLGCALIDTNVFKHLDKPYYFWQERQTGKHTGEDIWFCNAAKAAGYKIVADGRVKCQHVGRKVYG